MRTAVFALGIVLVSGCSSSSATTGSAPDAGPANGGCPASFHPVGAMGLCEPLVFEGDCPAGSMPKIGFDACQPVGWHDCPKGFVDDPSGWGCAEVIPATACTGATRDAIGSATCVPLGDCAAAFPPANATLFVSPTGPVDATHFQKIGDAITAAPAGAVIAVDTGNYSESLGLAKPVTLLGRCAANVHIQGTSSPVLSVTAAGVEVHGVTASGPGIGASVAGGDFTLVDSALDGNFDVGLDLESVGAAHLLRSVIRNTQAKSDVSGFGAEVIFGAKLDLTDSVIAKSTGGAILEGEPGSSVTITNSVVRDTDSDTTGQFGYGINARSNAAMNIQSSVFIANTTAAVRVSKGATATVNETVLRGTLRDVIGNDAFGFIVVDGGKLTATKIASIGNEGGGIVTLSMGSVATVTDSVLRAQLGTQGTNPAGDLGNGGYVFSGGRLELTGCALVNNRRSGVDVFDAGTVLALTRSIITGTTSSLVDKMGMGLEIATNASGIIKDSAITHNLHTGIYLWDGGTLDLSTSVIRDTQLQVFQSILGHGLLSQDSPHVVVSSCEFSHNTAIGLAFSNSSATISGTAIVGNAIGIHAQDGSTLKDVDDASGDPGNLDILVSKDTVFTDNGAKTGSGIIPLPMPIPPSRP